MTRRDLDVLLLVLGALLVPIYIATAIVAGLEENEPARVERGEP